MKMYTFIRAAITILCFFGLLTSTTAKVKTGQFNGTLNDPETGKVYTKYAALVPSRAKNSKNELGLIVLLHGKGGSEKQGIASGSISLKAAKAENDYILLSLKSRDVGWAKHDFSSILKAVQWALKTYPTINRRRVYGVGFSSGAICFGNLAAEAQDVFAGVSLWAGNCRNFPKEKGAGDTGVQYYIIHGEKDPVVKPKNILKAVSEMKKYGTRHVFHNIRNGTHGAPYKQNVRPILWPDMINWFSSIRNSKIPLNPKEKVIVEGLEKRIDKGFVLTARDIEKLYGISGVEVNDLLLKMATNKEQVTQRSFLAFCKSRFVGPTLMKEVIKLSSSKYGAVKKGTNEIVEKAVRWQATEVVDHLCEVAVNEDLQIDDRKNALLLLQEYFYTKPICVIDTNWIGTKLASLKKSNNRSIQTAYKALMKK
ncbi:MAG: dienelactone hydrolase family protein [Lentisphaeraceae bacterium]|nr:dienelactone hydrolase family protein [Lentisphaeraceae bacterium]